MMKYGLIWVSVLALGMALASCNAGGKSSVVEGKLVDWNGEPVAGVKITAAQVQPIKGYEQFEAVTGSDGSFRIRGLFPSSQYVLKPWSDKWTCDTSSAIDSAPQGETAILASPLVIDKAYAKPGGSVVTNLATGASRFTVTPSGMITDSETGLEWVTGPDQHTRQYAQAEHWVANCNLEGGGWRMPTRQELAALRQNSVGTWNNLDPVFDMSKQYVWAEPRDSTSAYYLGFSDGREFWALRGHRGNIYDSCGILAVRSGSR